MPRKQTCACCGSLRYTGTECRPQGGYICLRCRREFGPFPIGDRAPRKAVACLYCGETMPPRPPGRLRKFCSAACASRATAATRGRAQTPKGQRAGRRSDREAAAAGLSGRQRRRLRQRWIARGVGCAFCDGAAETVDHVIPLSRGGSNFEGNLLPACRRCNSARSDLLISEWRHGGRRRSDYVHRPELRAAKPRREVLPRPTCELCGDECPPRRRRYCSAACMLESNARQQRDAYRVAHGLPVDPAQPTRPRRRTWEVTSCQLELALSAA